MSENEIDLGSGHRIRFTSWKPDRSIPKNAELFKDIPDDPRAGAVVTHLKPDGSECEGHIMLNPKISTPSACWQVLSWEPLTLSPSLLCTACGDHGFIKNGKWVKV